MPQTSSELKDPFDGLIEDQETEPVDEDIEDDFGGETEFEEPVNLAPEEEVAEEEQPEPQQTFNADVIKGLQELGATLKERLPEPQKAVEQEQDVIVPMQYVDQLFVTGDKCKALAADLGPEGIAELNKIINGAVKYGYDMAQQFAGGNIRRVHQLVPDAVAKVINNQNELRTVADEFKAANVHLYTIGVKTPEEAAARARAIQMVVNSTIRDHPERLGTAAGFAQNLADAKKAIESSFPELTKKVTKSQDAGVRGGARRVPATFAGTTGKSRRGSQRTSQNVDEAAQLGAFMDTRNVSLT